MTQGSFPIKILDVKFKVLIPYMVSYKLIITPRLDKNANE